jgi:cytochrome b involved in lipid metabolism
LIDVGGQDATEAFEDVGHSDEAREVLEGLLIGTLKRQVSKFIPTSEAVHDLLDSPVYLEVSGQSAFSFYQLMDVFEDSMQP